VCKIKLKQKVSDSIQMNKIFIESQYSISSLKLMIKFYHNMCKYKNDNSDFKFNDYVSIFIQSLSHESNMSYKDISSILYNWYYEIENLSIKNK